jgi:hypothetical protein
MAYAAFAESPLVLRQQKSDVDPAGLDGYIGYYRISGSLVIKVTREGERLFGQATAQPRFDLYPETDQEFFAKIVDAQITFTTGPRGRATQLSLHQNGVDRPAKRIDEDMAKKIADEVEKKHEQQTASPESEGA